MLKLVTPAAELPVSLAALKEHLSFDNPTGASDHDADLSLKLSAATEFVSSELKRCLITATYDLYLPCWPSRSYLELPLGNLQSITSVKYTDSAGVVNTVSTSTYKTARTYAATDGALDAGIGRLYLAYGTSSWPTATLDTGEPIAIRFVCGWADAASVPVPIKQSILMLAAHFYRNRDAVVLGNTAAVVSAEVALGVSRLIAVYEDRRW